MLSKLKKDLKVLFYVILLMIFLVMVFGVMSLITEL